MPQATRNDGTNTENFLIFETSSVFSKVVMYVGLNIKATVGTYSKKSLLSCLITQNAKSNPVLRLMFGV